MSFTNIEKLRDASEAHIMILQYMVHAVTDGDSYFSSREVNLMSKMQAKKPRREARQESNENMIESR